MVASSLVVVSSARNRPTPSPSSYLGTAQTPSSVKFTGNPATDFPSDALLYTNLFTPWGSGYNNLTSLYGTWNSTELFLGVSGVLFGGAPSKDSSNNFLLAISNGTEWGTTNLSNLVGVSGVNWWNRSIDFTQPVNYLVFVSGYNSLFNLSAYEVTSRPTATTTTVASLGFAAYDNTVTSKGGAVELALNFSDIYPSGFPAHASVKLFAAIMGGSGPWIGPTIPSGDGYDWGYGGITDTAHDLPDGYLLVNSYYTLNLDPRGLGVPDSGITPNYDENYTFHTVTFTGNLGTDFAPGEKALLNTNTGWSPTNELNSAYLTWNDTTLFLGFNTTIGGTANRLGIFLSNDTKSLLGTYTLQALNDPTLNRTIIFSQPVNFITTVNYSATSVPLSLTFNEVTTPAATSNTTVMVQNVTSQLTSVDLAKNSIEMAIPLSLLFGEPSSAFPLIGEYANLSMVAAIYSGSGNYTGPTLPAGQTSTNGYNTYHAVGPDTLLNTFFTENLDPYGDAVSAVQINPTYTYGRTYHTVTFTGTVTNDFVPPEIVGTSNFTGWSTSNLLNATYATWNFTTLFLGTNSTVGGGNYLMVAISNDTGQGATNFSKSNVPDLTRNITFGTPINFVFVYSSGARNGTLYGVNLVGTNSTQTNFTFVQNFTAAKDGEEFAIPWAVMYPEGSLTRTNDYGWGAGEFPPGLTPQFAAMIYGGNRPNGYPGDYIGPTIPMGQSSSGTPQTALIGAFVTLYPDPNKDGFAEPGLVPSIPPALFKGNPIRLNIVLNDHQPLYGPIGGTNLLPWTIVHLEEYAEQALIAGLHPNVNITYSLSGSLLYQIEAIARGEYQNIYLEAAEIPNATWSDTVYTAVNTYGDTFLQYFVPSSEWNTTTVAFVLQNDLAFNTPLWAYNPPFLSTNASKLYAELDTLYSHGATLNTTQLTDALAEFFLWSTSYPIISGQLGSQYANSTMWAFFNDTSFTISDIKTIAGFYPVEAQLVLSSFEHDRMLNDNSVGNVELITTPFDHPILPLLLLNNWTDLNGPAITKGVWSNDTLAQLQIGSGLYSQIFGQAPLGLWSPEQAVSNATVPFINETGYEWTSSSQAALAAAGIGTDSQPVSPKQMEALYTPYRVVNGDQSTVMVFRDDSLSNDWGFNYGRIANTSGSWAAVNSFIDYLKNVYATVPRANHSAIMVTVALDGENWMFMGNPTFPGDAVPFLEDLYTALGQNSSWLNTTTMQQFLATSPTLPTIHNMPIASWNAEPYDPGINQYLGQWAGDPLQDAAWQRLTLVRSEVEAYGASNGLSQPMTLATLEKYDNFPFLNEWNNTTPEGKYVEAWTAIYGAEGSDIYFSYAPDQSPTAQNDVVFDQVFRADLSLALSILGLPLTPYLTASYEPAVTPTTWGTNQSDSPVLNGLLWTTSSFTAGTAYSVSHSNAWQGSYVERTGDTTSGAAEVSQVNYAFDVSNLYISVQVNGATSAYKSPNFYTPATDALNVYFSEINPGTGTLESLNVPDAVYTVGSTSFGFAATVETTIQGNSITPGGSATLGVFSGTAAGTWQSVTSVVGDAFVGNLLQMQVPYAELNGFVPGDSIEFFVAAVNGTTGVPVSWAGPMIVSVPISLSKLTLVSTIHNPAPDTGPGGPYTYTYPTNDYSGTTIPEFPPHSFDIEWMSVSENPYTVQFNFTFGNLSNPFGGQYGFGQPIIDVYIHIPGASGGSTAGIPGANINISSADPWQWAIQASGYTGVPNNFIESSGGQIYSASMVVTSNTGLGPSPNPKIISNATVSVRVPTALIGTAISTYTYVIVAGSQDGEGQVGDNWRQVDPGPATAYQGGGAPSGTLGTWSPNVYSYIAPAVVNQGATLTQSALLSTFSVGHYATLDGITLPTVVKPKTTTVALGPAAAFVNVSGDPEGFYAFGDQVFESTSPNGVEWNSTSLVNLSFTPTGMAAAVSPTTVGLLAWSGASYAFLNVATGAFENGTASSTIEAASVTDSVDGFLIALDVGGVIELGGPGATPWAFYFGATSVGLTTSNGVSYLGYANPTGIYIEPLALGESGALTVGTTSLFTAALPPDTTATGLSIAADPLGAFAVAVDLANSTASNIYFANGTGAHTLKALTSDGADFSPSVILGESGGVYMAYVGFMNSVAGGNVFFLPASVGTVGPTMVPVVTPPAPPTPWLLYILLGLVALVAAILLVAFLLAARGGRAKKPPEETPPTEPTEMEAPAEVESPPNTGAGPG